MTRGAIVARGLALLVAGTFASVPFGIWLLLSLGESDGATLARGLLAVTYFAGAALLAVGARRWYGTRARLLRVWGFVLLLAGALVTVSLAFLLVPLLLLAAPSLRKRERDERPVGAAEPPSSRKPGFT